MTGQVTSQHMHSVKASSRLRTLVDACAGGGLNACDSDVACITCSTAGTTCQRQNQWYWQCLY